MCLEDGDSHEVNSSGFSIPCSIPNHIESRESKFLLSVKNTIRNHAVSKSRYNCEDLRNKPAWSTFLFVKQAFPKRNIMCYTS